MNSAANHRTSEENSSADGSPTIPAWLKFNHTKSILISVVFGLLLTATIARIIVDYQTPARIFDSQHTGFCDFHNGIYFPADAFNNRINPYGVSYAEQYEVPRPIPFYSPATLFLHAPFALFELRTAEVIYFVWLLGLLLLLAWMTVKFSGIRPQWQHVLLVSSIIMITRSGHSTLFGGYFTFELIIGTLVALQYGKSRPLLAAAGLLVASGKPTYVIPLGIVMLARGNLKAVVLGAVISAVVAAAGFGWLASSTSVDEIIEGVKQGQSEHLSDPQEFPVNTWLRVDTPAIIAKWTDWNPDEKVQLAMMCLLIAPVCIVLWRTRNRLDNGEGAANLPGLICCLAVVVTFYHHYYDMLLVIAPCFALAVGSQNWKQVGKRTRWTMLICAMLPLLNYTTAGFVLERITAPGETSHKLLTSINATFALIGLIVASITALRLSRGNPSEVVAIETHKST